MVLIIVRVNQIVVIMDLVILVILVMVMKALVVWLRL